MEYALASNPANATSVPDITTGTQEDTQLYFTFTYTRRAGVPGLAFSIQSSPDLKDWEAASPHLEILAGPIFNTDGTETLTLRDKRSVSETKIRFLRLTVAID